MTQEEMDLLWEEANIRNIEQWEYRNATDDGEQDPRAWCAIVDWEGRVYSVFLSDYYEPISVSEIPEVQPRSEDDLSQWDITIADGLDEEDDWDVGNWDNVIYNGFQDDTIDFKDEEE